MTKKQKITAILALAIGSGPFWISPTPPAALFLSNRRSTSSSPTARSHLNREKCSRKPPGVLTRLCRQNLRSFQSKTWPSKFPSKNEARLGASFPAGLFVSAEMDNTPRRYSRTKASVAANSFSDDRRNGQYPTPLFAHKSLCGGEQFF